MTLRQCFVKPDQPLCGWQAISQTSRANSGGKRDDRYAQTCTITTLTRDPTVVEIARLVNKAHLLIQALGGLLPGLKPESMQHITSVLDVACGPGIWTLELARRQPKISVIGIDTSESMIAYARRISQQQAMGNTAYLTIPSFAEPFPFAEASFDLINMPFIAKVPQER